MTIKKLTLWLLFVCSFAQASLTQKFAKLNLDQVPARGTMLAQDQNGFALHPIFVTLYTNGEAQATIRVEDQTLSVQRWAANSVACSQELSVYQRITMCAAMEEAFIAAKFRADKKKIKKGYADILSYWIKPPNKP